MASAIQIDRLLDTVIRQSASDLHLTVNKKPTLRIRGRLVELNTKVLEPADTVALMKSITPERAQNELQEEGNADFGFAYGDAARFRVSTDPQVASTHLYPGVTQPHGKSRSSSAGKTTPTTSLLIFAECALCRSAQTVVRIRMAARLVAIPSGRMRPCVAGMALPSSPCLTLLPNFAATICAGLM